MKLKIFVMFAAALVVTGCSKNSVSPTENQVTYKKMDNTDHVVGNKNHAIKILSYNKLINDKVDTKITFYIDKLPFERKFTTCPGNASKAVTKFTYNDKKEITDIKYKETKECNSYIYVNKDLRGSFKINILEEYEMHSFKNKNIPLRHMSRNTSSHYNFNNEGIFFQMSNNISIKTFWKWEQ